MSNTTEVPSGKVIRIKLKLGERAYCLDMSKPFVIDLLELKYDSQSSTYGLEVEDQCLYCVSKSFNGANTKFNQMIAKQLLKNKIWKEEIEQLEKQAKEKQALENEQAS